MAIMSILSPGDELEFKSDYNNFGAKYYKDGKDFYAQWGLKGHNGQDIATPVGVEIFAPFDCMVVVKHEKGGFGTFIELIEPIKSYGNRRRVRVAHLSKVLVRNRTKVNAGDSVALSGRSGGVPPHIHWDCAYVDKEGKVINYKNGYHGCFDIFKKGWIKTQENSIL